MSQIPYLLKIILTANTCATGNNDPRCLEVDFLLLDMLFEYLDRKFHRRDLNLFLDYLCLFIAVSLGHWHYTLTNRRHLRPSVIVDDRSDDITAKSGPDLEKQVVIHGAGLFDLMSADLQIGTISRQTSLCRTCDPRCKITTACGSTVKHDLWLVLVDQIVNNLRIWVGLVMLKQRMLGKINLVSTIKTKLFSQFFNIITQQNSTELNA